MKREKKLRRGDEASKDLFKLVNNAVFGKTVDNLRKRISIEVDLSKYLMYDFHHNTWMRKFPNSTLLFTDTDALVYEVIGHDLCAEFDFSEYPKITSYNRLITSN